MIASSKYRNSSNSKLGEGSCKLKKQRLLVYVFTVITFLNWTFVVQAETVRLKNGDTLTGEIISETDESISISHEVLGTVEIKKEFLVASEKKVIEPAPVV